MKLKFEPSDFYNYCIISASDNSILRGGEASAQQANAKLDAWLSEATVVYGCVAPGDFDITWAHKKIAKDTHRALLVNIEEISKEPCKHEPDESTGKFYGAKRWVDVSCIHCGVKLKATWSEAT